MTADPTGIRSESAYDDAITNYRIAEPTDSGSVARPSPLTSAVEYVSDGFAPGLGPNSLVAAILVGTLAFLIV